MLPPPWFHSTTPILSAPKFLVPHLRKEASVADFPIPASLFSSAFTSLPSSMTKRWFRSSSTSLLCQNFVPPVSITNRTSVFEVAACISLRSLVAFPPENSLDSRSVPQRYTKMVQLPFFPIVAELFCSGRRISILPVALSTCMKRPCAVPLPAESFPLLLAESCPPLSAESCSPLPASPFSFSALLSSSALLSAERSGPAAPLLSGSSSQPVIFSAIITIRRKINKRFIGLGLLSCRNKFVRDAVLSLRSIILHLPLLGEQYLAGTQVMPAWGWVL